MRDEGRGGPAGGADRFAGALVGQCLGDALGFPMEGAAPAACARYADGLFRGEQTPRGRAAHPFGQYTDDSQLARELMISLVARRGLDPADYARRIRDLFIEGRVVGAGRATAEAADRLARGADWTESGMPPPSAGNGSAMRAAPIGLFYHDDPDARRRAAHDQGRITHADPRCSAGAAVIAGAVAIALRPGPVEPRAVVAELAEDVEELDDGFAGELRRLDDWLALPPAEAAPRIARAGLAPGREPDIPGISGFVVPSVLWSLYAFLRSPDDYAATIRTAIAAGGDVDTTAAMAGAVSGARVGLHALPLGLAAHLQDRGDWGLDALVGLAGDCHRAAAR